MNMFGFGGDSLKAPLLGIACALALTACNEATADNAPPANETATVDAAGPQATTQPPTARQAQTGPLDGEWRCKINGDIPIGLITFTGGHYSFRTTTPSWKLNPNQSDGDGVVEFTGDGYILPQTGPLKDGFEVTGAHSDTVINWNNNLGALMSCQRSPG